MQQLVTLIVLSMLIFASCNKSIEEPFEKPDCVVRKYNVKILPYDSLWFVYSSPAPLNEDYPGDPEGVPLFLNPDDGKYYYHPVNIAMKGMGYINSYILTGDSRYLLRVQNWVDKLSEISNEINGAIYFPYQFNMRVHGSSDTLFAPWYSGMAQGLVMELVVRLYNVTHNPRYLKAADKIFQSFKNVNRDSYPWVVYITPDKYYWIEEYPMDVPDNVLNGFIFGLFGLYEYWMLTKDPEAKFYIDASLTTLQDKLPLFRNPGGISYYCLKHHHQDPLYHSLHVNQIRFLYKMTGEQFFKDFADSLYTDYH